MDQERANSRERLIAALEEVKKEVNCVVPPGAATQEFAKATTAALAAVIAFVLEN